MSFTPFKLELLYLNDDIEGFHRELTLATDNKGKIKDEYAGAIKSLLAHQLFQHYIKPHSIERIALLDKLLEYGIDSSKLSYLKTDIILSFTGQLTVTKSLNNLPVNRHFLLPLLLKVYFKKNKVSPLNYLKRAPEWHKKYVLFYMSEL